MCLNANKKTKIFKRFNKKNNHFSHLDIYKSLNDLRCPDRSIICIHDN